nr:DNA-directed DNA polymerase [Tanacetum cinerariifolium]
MSTRSSTRNLFPPLDNPELTIRRRYYADPTLLNDFEMAAEGNGDLPSIKVNGVTDDALRLYLFPHSLTHHATAWFDRLPRNSINTFEQMTKMFLGKYSPPSMVTKLRNEITNFRQRPDESLFEAWERYKLSIDRCPNHNTLSVTQIDTFYNGLTLRHRDTINAAAGGTFMKRRPKECYDLIENMTAHHNDWDTSAQQTTVGQTQNVYAAGAYQDGSRTLPGNIVTNPKEELKGITTRSGTAYQGPTIPTTSSSLPKVVEHETEVTKDTVHPTNNGSTKDVQPPCGTSSLPELSPTYMTLELANHSISHPVGVVEDVFVKVGTFHFPADFVVVDFDFDPRVPLILGRSFLKTRRDLIDVFEGELTLRVGREAITFNLDQTSRYSANYNDMTANRIDVINMACEEYSQEVLGFFDMIASGNPTPYYDPIASTSSPTLTPYGDSDFLLEEVDTFLAFENDPTSPKELKICEAKTDKSSIDEPPKVELKDLPPHLEYAFLEGDDKLPVIIAKDLSDEEETALITVLKSHKRAIAWKLSDIKGIDPEFCTHKILMEDDFEPAVQHQRRVNPKMHDVIKNEVLKLLDVGLIYPISDSPWVSLVHCVPKKGGFTVVENEENELILTRLVTGWRVCIDYHKVNEATRKYHFPLPFMDQMLERLAGNEYYCFLDVEVFMDDFSVLGNLFQTCLSYLEKMLKRCEDTNLYLNWEKSYFMVKEGIVLGHKISKNGIEVDKAKVDVISKLPYPTTIKGIHSFLGHASFYRRFIKEFSKIARPMTRLLEKDTPFFFSKECVKAFQTLKRKLTKAPILIAPDWDLPFELMCDASAVLGKRQEKHFRPIHYASKTMTEAESNYTTIEKEMLAVVYAFEKFWSYLIVNKSIVYTDHSALKYLFAKKDSKARFLRRVLLL